MKKTVKWNGKKVADVETLHGYAIVLRSADWDAEFEVWRPLTVSGYRNAEPDSWMLLRKFATRAEARGWVEDQHYDIRKI